MLHKTQRAFKNPFFMVYVLVLIYYLKSYFKPCFFYFILKTFCSTLNWRIRFWMSLTGYKSIMFLSFFVNSLTFSCQIRISRYDTHEIIFRGIIEEFRCCLLGIFLSEKYNRGTYHRIDSKLLAPLGQQSGFQNV